MIAKDLVPGTGIKPFAIMKGNRKYGVIGVRGTGAAVYALSFPWVAIHDGGRVLFLTWRQR
jgi:hypothetical protein